MNFGNRANSQETSKKDRLSKDCFISEISGTQPYMQIEVVDTNSSVHDTDIGVHALNLPNIYC